MILGHINHLDTMSEINSVIINVIKQVLTHNLQSLEPGSYPINGDNIFVNVMSPTTMLPSDKQFEIHQRYIDIQILLQGEECVEFGLLSTGKEIQAYHSDDDYQLCEQVEHKQSVELSPGMFAIFVPNEPHKPGLEPKSGKTTLKKAVIKLKQSYLAQKA